MKDKRIIAVESPYADLNAQMINDEEFALAMKPVVENYTYEWDRMIPKMTYDEWVICLYEKDNVLYFIDLDGDTAEPLVRPVTCVHIAEYDNGFDSMNDNSTLMDNEFYGSFCCGEVDDCTGYAFFELRNE